MSQTNRQFLLAEIPQGKLGPEQTPVISFRPAVVAAVKRARPDLPAYWVVSLNAKDKTQ